MRTRITKNVHAIWDGNRNTKKISCYSGRARETQTSLLAVWEWEFKAFPLGNIWEWEFPLMPGV